MLRAERLAKRALIDQLPEFERMAYGAAVTWWPYRTEYCPNRVRDEHGVPQLITWERLFEIKFGRTMHSYVSEEQTRKRCSFRDAHPDLPCSNTPPQQRGLDL